MSVLRKVPKGERNLVRAAGILSSPADQRAKVNADCHLQSSSRCHRSFCPSPLYLCALTQVSAAADQIQKSMNTYPRPLHY